MLTSIELDNWKSFGTGEDARNVVTLGPLTLFVGPNGSGKSNVLDALRFLQGAAFDYPLSDVLRGRWEGQREVWPAIRGSIVEAARAGTEDFGLDTSWNLDGRLLHHSIGVSCGGDVSVKWERLFEGDPYLFDTHADSLESATGRDEGGALRVALKGGGKSGRSPKQVHSSRRSLLGQVEVKDRVIEAVVTGAHAVRDALRSAVFLDIRPALMRDYRPENGGHLGIAGENISPVLSGLPPERLAGVVDWLSELSAAEVTGIDFDRTQLREVMMILVEADGRRISARSASDGTLRFLGELVALLTSPRGSLVVLEEPDVGLHPSRVRLLAELLEEVTSAAHGVQVIATTHSPTLLAHLSRDALGAVVGFARRRDTGTTVCTRLMDLPHFGTLADARDIEHLVSTGWLERAL